MKITRCKLSKKTQRKLLEFFIAEVTARTAADLLGIQPNSAALFYRKIRQVIMYYLDQDAIEVFEGQIELDESYFGGVRKGKRGRGAAGKVAVFGMLKRGGKVYVKIVPDTKTATLMPIITRKIAPDSIVYTDSYRSYNALDVSDFSYHRINHSEKFVEDKNHINGVENFWNQAKRVLRKYNGIDRNAFILFIKECEFIPIFRIKLNFSPLPLG
ncbi:MULTISPECIES: IS1595 family transposase [Acinetobacter]|uniref:IS1595 family transposase n=1 Tax=Acinetobacter corruptisaponis TaxID=3045147 RepID=A0ABY8S6J3_9GAMM|nr:IS1595 family transposase [Acinetobacter sp. KCTC 92772]WHP07322.1 IS1595 family transposase [Acinetobacter sp. KCTC 92772]